MLDAEFYRKKAHHDEKTRIVGELQKQDKVAEVYMRAKLMTHEHDMEKHIKRKGGSVPEAPPSQQIYATIEALVRADPDYASKFKSDQATMLKVIQKQSPHNSLPIAGVYIYRVTGT